MTREGKARPKQGQGIIKRGSKQGQGKAKSRKGRGQGKAKVKSTSQYSHNLNRNYNLMGFDTIEINLVCYVLNLFQNSRYTITD